MEQTHATKQGDYFSFAFVDNMPKFDTSEPDVMEYLTGIAKHWVCDGRLTESVSMSATRFHMLFKNICVWN